MMLNTIYHKYLTLSSIYLYFILFDSNHGYDIIKGYYDKDNVKAR